MTPIYTTATRLHQLQRWAPLALTIAAIILTAANCPHPLDRKHGNW